MSSDLQLVEWCLRFTTVPFKPLVDQGFTTVPFKPLVDQGFTTVPFKPLGLIKDSQQYPLNLWWMTDFFLFMWRSVRHKFNNLY